MKLRMVVTFDCELGSERAQEKYGTDNPEAVAARVTEQGTEVMRELQAGEHRIVGASVQCWPI